MRPTAQLHGLGSRARGCHPRHLHLALGSEPPDMVLHFTTDQEEYHTEVQYGLLGGELSLSAPTRLTILSPADMCAAPAINQRYGAIFLYEAQLLGLDFDHNYQYRVTGSDSLFNFTSPPPPTPAQAPYNFLAYGDMGEDSHKSAHSPGAGQVLRRCMEDVKSGATRLVLHIGDISYADGLASVWDAFMAAITPVASAVPYMIGIGNHDYDYKRGTSRDPSGALPYHPAWGNFARDSGGECGVAAWARFRMPHGRPTLDGVRSFNPPFWYSFNHGRVRFVMVSTEHDLSPGSLQWEWLKHEFAGVDRCASPWVLVGMHRPMYVVKPHHSNRVVGRHLRRSLEKLFLKYGVNAVLSGHIHTYYRSCRAAHGRCVADDRPGIHHLVMGSGGHKLSGFKAKKQPGWLSCAENTHGHGRFTVLDDQTLRAEFVRASDGAVRDSVDIHNHVAGTGLCKWRYHGGEVVDGSPAVDLDGSEVLDSAGDSSPDAPGSLLDVLWDVETATEIFEEDCETDCGERYDAPQPSVTAAV